MGSQSSVVDPLAEAWAKPDREEKRDGGVGSSFQWVGHDKALGTYGEKELMELFDRFLFPRLKEEFDREGFLFTLDTSDAFSHVLTVSHKKLLRRSMPADAEFLLKMFIRRNKLDWHSLHPLQPLNRCAAFDAWIALLPKEHADIRLPFDALRRDLAITEIQYTYLQNPLRPFRPDRPQLPNQRYPGLGVGGPFMKMVASAAKSQHRDLVLNYPEAFHNAYIYNVKAGMRFLSPHAEAFFQLILQDLAAEIKSDFCGVAWAMYNGDVSFGNVRFVWPLWEMVLPVASDVVKFLKQTEELVERLKAIEPRPKFTIVRTN